MKKIISIIRSKTIRAYLKLKSGIGITHTTFTLMSGERLQIRNIDHLGLDLINESFENRVKDLIMENVKPGMVVLDIGANIGYYSVKMSTRVGNQGKVIAFEPNPAVTSELEQNIRLNTMKNIDVYPFALANQSGTLPFFNPEKGNEGHGSLKKNKTFDPASTIEVKVERLDDVLIKNGIKKVDFIKIDVEGAEYGVLQGARELLTSTHKPVIIFEAAENLCYAFGHTVYDTLRLVGDYGYKIENIDWGNWIATPKQN